MKRCISIKSDISIIVFLYYQTRPTHDVLEHLKSYL
jgi:hypothetical protein